MTKRTPEEAELPLPEQVTFVVKKEEGAPGAWETKIKACTDETIDDIKGRVREYLEEEHGLKFQLVLQQGQHSEHLGELSQALVATEGVAKGDRKAARARAAVAAAPAAGRRVKTIRIVFVFLGFRASSLSLWEPL